jgi:hypothetical protein
MRRRAQALQQLVDSRLLPVGPAPGSRSTSASRSSAAAGSVTFPLVSTQLTSNAGPSFATKAR